MQKIRNGSDWQVITDLQFKKSAINEKLFGKSKHRTKIPLGFLEGKENDFDIVFDFLYKFGELSDYKINGLKSKFFYIGNPRDSSNKYRENKGLT